ncbi:MAG: membrane protein insertion efficiency factor YidD [Micromonosporaceae bacterium]
MAERTGESPLNDGGTAPPAAVGSGWAALVAMLMLAATTLAAILGGWGRRKPDLRKQDPEAQDSQKRKRDCDCDGCDGCDGCSFDPCYVYAFPRHDRPSAPPVGLPTLMPVRATPTAPARFVARMIRAYQRRISPRLAIRCRHTPTCSEYGLRAIERYGLAVGARLAYARVRRCNRGTPYGTVDPVPAAV